MLYFRKPSNQDIGNMLDEIAGLLELQHANPHRVWAYRNGARFVRQLEKELSEIVYGGNGEILQTLPGIGESLSRLIVEYVKTGKSQLLLHLKGVVSPEELFEQIPGIGHDLAVRIVKELNIESLEELELAAHDGRLAQIEGFGPKRVEAIQMILAGWMSGFGRRRVRAAVPVDTMVAEQPAVALLLEVDREYRAKASSNTLRKIAPRRFNPDRIAWLPIMHLEMEGWSFTALFSNTLRAHELGKTNDWVVIYFEKESYDGQSTIVTETRGPLIGKRVVRGREKECSDHFKYHQKAQ